MVGEYLYVYLYVIKLGAVGYELKDVDLAFVIQQIVFAKPLIKPQFEEYRCSRATICGFSSGGKCTR